MADDPQRNDASDEPVTTDTGKEDAETTATRRELKQTSISEKDSGDQQTSSQGSSNTSENEDEAGKGDDKASARTKTPDLKMRDVPAIPHGGPKEVVSSPKKKRAHDQVDEQPGDTEDSLASSTELAATATLSRTDRSEPEKKRARDEQSGDEVSRPTSAGSGPEKSSDKKTGPSDQQEKAKQTSSSAFASSGFAKLASSTASPFGALGGSGKNVFGGGSSSPSPFGGFGATAVKSPTEPPKLTFGGSGSSTGASSPFGGLNGGQPSAFGSALGGGSAFSSLLSGGPKLGSFAKPGGAFGNDKPSRPFGAPESEEEDGDKGDEEDAEEGSGDDARSDDDEKEKEKEKEKKEKSEEPKDPSDDKKKPRLQKVVIDNGEAGEVALLQVRAKMFVMEKGVGWKERGAGILKVNVPQSSVDFDNQHNPIPDSFDASVLDDEDHKDGSMGRKSVRLVMRQDHTLRVILNTVILPSMVFQLNTKLKSSYILFMAFDGAEPTQVQMKLSEANANLFINLMKNIQRSLQDV